MKFNLFATALSATAAVGLSLAGPVHAGTWTLIPQYIDPATGSYAQPFAINDAGWITGYAENPATYVVSGFIRDPSGNYTIFSVASDTEPRGIGNNNRVVGISYDADFNSNEFSRTADGTVTWLTNPRTGLPLDGIAQGQNSAGDIVGDYLTGPDGVSGPAHGYILNGSTFTDLSFPGSDETKARGINDNGVVVGAEVTGDSTSAFIDNNGVWTSYDHPGANGGTYFENINDHGLIVGQWDSIDNDGNMSFNSFLYNLNTGAVEELVAPGEPASFTFNQAFGLNNHDQVLDLSYENWLFNADAVPEPGTWAIMLVGLGCLGGKIRGRSRARSPSASTQGGAATKTAPSQ